jgi:hypothetical protein
MRISVDEKCIQNKYCQARVIALLKVISEVYGYISDFNNFKLHMPLQQ